MLPAKETAHVEKARGALIAQFKNRRVVQGFLDVFARRVQDIENVLWDVIDSRILDTATGAQLEDLGELVGELRLGRIDDDYRPAIRLRIRVNRSKGRIADIIDIAILADTIGTPRVTEYQFLGFEVEIYGQAGERYIAGLLSQARAASSYGLLTASALGLSDLLSFDDAVSPDASVETFSDFVSGLGRVCAAGYGMPTDFFSGYDGSPLGAYGYGVFGGP
jgi:hypothetical protein